ncbi:MAG: AI-2E family transporter [Firmicutes bacterium]|nr:AI-2E family transporter [Bacillota bacterium]
MKLDWKTCFKIGASIFVLYLCINYWPFGMKLIGRMIGAASPLILGCVIAYIVNILMSMYERHMFPASASKKLGKVRRPLAMLLAFLTLLGIIALLIRLVVPELINCVQLIFSELPGAIIAVIHFVDSLHVVPEDIIAQLEGTDWQAQILSVFGFLTSGIGSVMGVVVTTVASVFSTVITTVIALIFSIYLLLGKDTLGSQSLRVMNHYLPDVIYRRVLYVLKIMNDCFHRYIVGQSIEAVILGSLCAAGMFILRLPYATMVGALIAFTALIPVAGAYIGAAVGAFMILTVNPMQALVFLIYLVILQQLEGNIIYPKVVGSSMGLPAIWVLAAVTIGGGIMGIIGMLLGVPLAATAYRILKNDLNNSHTI